MTSSSNEQADYLCDEALVMCKSGEFQNLLGKVKRDASLGLNVWQRSDRQPETTSIPMARAPAFEKTRNELKVTSALKNPADRSRLVRHATRLIVEQAPESEGGRRTNVIPHGFGARSTEAHVRSGYPRQRNFEADRNLGIRTQTTEEPTRAFASCSCRAHCAGEIERIPLTNFQQWTDFPAFGEV